MLQPVLLMGDSDFSFPVLSQPAAIDSKDSSTQKQVPLTVRSTVVHVAQPVQPGAAPTASAPAPVAAEGRRNKVPLEKGYSQVDWLKLSRSGADLTGGAGIRQEIPLSEVQQHASPDDAWMALQGRVYNIGPYLKFHPGGVSILLKAAGTDGTALFQKFHPWVNAHALLEKCYLGRLQK